jgi:hypothetical protein
VGAILLDPLGSLTGQATEQLLIEPDPLLGNLPWPSVETASGSIGLQFNLEESPSLLLDRRFGSSKASGFRESGKPLIVGASIASGEALLLPEVLNEARAVARFGNAPNLLLAGQATEAQVASRLTTASAIHFAGHAAQQDGATRLLLAPQRRLQQVQALSAGVRTGPIWIAVFCGGIRPWLPAWLFFPPARREKRKPGGITAWEMSWIHWLRSAFQTWWPLAGKSTPAPPFP